MEQAGQSYKAKPTAKDNIYAFLLDAFLWSYMAMIGHKILWNKYIMDIRYPEFHWYQPVWSVAFGALIAIVGLWPNHFSMGRRAFGLDRRNLTLSPLRAPYVWFSWLALILTFVTGWKVSQVSFFEFFSSAGIAGANRIFSALLTPNTGILVQAIELAIETIFMAFMATVFSLPVAFLVSFMAAKNLMNHSPVTKAVYYAWRFVLNVTRSMEPIVWAIVFSVWVGIGPFAGMLALLVHSVASLAKLYSEQIESINDGPIEAMIATGAHPIQIIWYGVVPQVVLPFLSFTIYRWDINVRMATIIGLVGGGGIGTLLIQYSQAGKWNEVGLLAMIIFFIVWVMDHASAQIREAIK